MTDEPDTPRTAQPPPPGPYPHPAFYPLYPAPENEINLLDPLRVLRQRRWIIALVTVQGTAGAVWYALYATPIYPAQAVIAPPGQNETGAATAALSALGGFGAEIAGSLGFNVGGPTGTASRRSSGVTDSWTGWCGGRISCRCCSPTNGTRTGRCGASILKNPSPMSERPSDSSGELSLPAAT